MKNFVSGWRRPTPRPGVAEAPKGKAAIAEPEPQPMERKRRKAAPAPDAEVIDARPARKAAAPLSFPRLGVPANMGQWGMLLVFAGLFKLSADATHAALGGQVDYTVALVIQAALSLVERFHFAGNRNGFTWGMVGVDTLFTAVGFGLVLLPQFFQTPAYGFMVDMMGGFGAGGFSGFSLGVLALVLGFVVAYSGDKALDLAMGR